MMTSLVLLAVTAVVAVSLPGEGAAPYRLRLGWYEWFSLFLSSAFLGCCFEMLFVWLGTGTWMSRSSLLYGPFSLVWGLGAVLMALILSPLRRYGRWAIFAGGAILGGGFEYLTSLVLEVIYGRVFWDYSHFLFDLDGRTNLLYALFWGAAGTFWIYWLLPRLLRLIARIPARPGRIVAAGLAVLLVGDILISAAALQRMDERSHGEAAGNHLDVLLDVWYDDSTMQHRYQNMSLPSAPPQELP